MSLRTVQRDRSSFVAGIADELRESVGGDARAPGSASTAWGLAAAGLVDAEGAGLLVKSCCEGSERKGSQCCDTLFDPVEVRARELRPDPHQSQALCKGCRMHPFYMI